MDLHETRLELCVPLLDDRVFVLQGNIPGSQLCNFSTIFPFPLDPNFLPVSKRDSVSRTFSFLCISSIYIAVGRSGNLQLLLFRL